MNKLKCDKCGLEISNSNYKRHTEKCSGKCDENKVIKIDDNWKTADGKYKCPHCDKIYTKNGICTHIFLNHTEEGNIKMMNNYNNLRDYNEKVRIGEIKRNKNQYELAKEKGEILLMSDETKKKISDKKTGSIVTNETKSKISFQRSRFLEEIGSGGFKHIKWYKIKNIKNEEFIVRGTWELLIAELLNTHNIYWVRKKYLKYHDNDDIKRTYTPDFYIPLYDRYIEVKGYFSEKDKLKLTQVIFENKINLLLIKEYDIKNQNILIDKIIAPVSPLSYTQ